MSKVEIGDYVRYEESKEEVDMENYFKEHAKVHTYQVVDIDKHFVGGVDKWYYVIELPDDVTFGWVFDDEHTNCWSVPVESFKLADVILIGGE
jgi:hypothetical protein